MSNTISENFGGGFMKAEKNFFERYHGISSLLEKGMPSDVLFEGKSFNIEATRNQYIPYNCRCEAIGGGRDKGLLYRGLDGAWDVSEKENAFAYKRMFKLPQNWKGYRLYLIIDDISPKTTVYINGALACFYCDNDGRKYIESEVTAHINFDLDNEIVIISEEIENNILCRASIIARKFVHIRDFKCDVTSQSVSLDVYMSKEIPAKVLAEVYDNDLNLIASCESEIIGKGNLKCEVDDEVRLVLLVCGDEVIPVPMDSHKRPDLPIGEEISDYDTGSCREFEITAVDLEKGIFDISAIGDCKSAVLQYKIFAENGTLSVGELPLNFEVGNISRAMINCDVPSLSFYEYFIDFSVNNEFIGQFKLPVKQTACERILSTDMPVFTFSDIRNEKVFVSGVNFEHVFDTEKGVIEKISKEGCDVLKGVSAVSFAGIPTEHVRSIVMSRDTHHIGISSIYSAKRATGDFSVSVLTILYSDGEISVSVSGIAANTADFDVAPVVITYPLADSLLKSKVYGEADPGNVMRAGVYDSYSYSGECFNNCRWTYSYGERVPGLLVKGMPFIDVLLNGTVCTRNISPGISLLFKPDKNGMIASSFILKPVFCENEDIIREARTIPFVSQ